MDEVKALLQKGHVAKAANVAEQRLRSRPEQPEALYILAVCYRYLGRPDDALQTLDVLRETAPEYARAYQEQGHNYCLIGDSAEAIAAFKQAVSLNPALLASWRVLSELLEQREDAGAAEWAGQQVLRLASLPAELVSVESMLHEGKLLKAEQLCRSFLQRHAHHVEAMRLLARLGAQLLVLDDAEFLLESCLEFEPDHDLARLDYIDVLHRRQKHGKALEQAKILCMKDPGNSVFDLAFANESFALGDTDTALELYDALLKNMPANPYTLLVRGHALKTVGRRDAAISSYKRAVAARIDFGDAFWSLANLKTYRFTDDELAQMQSAEEARGTSLVDRFHLCFALGKAFEDRAEFDVAFSYYDRGNALKKAQLRYSIERTEAEFAAQIQECRSELFKSKAGLGHEAADPIFIVGLPRAGSTLLEQILASHSHVDGTMELPNVLALAHRLNGRKQLTDDPRYPKILHDLTAEQLEKFGERYLRDTELYRDGAPHFTDKMPNNFRHIGLIQLILPNAKIIDARRHPMACCFSGFKQLFAEGQEFTYGLEEIGRYYGSYVELMDHWDAVLPGRILRVHYEDIVADLETQVSRILDFCGLPFEEACLQFHKTERDVRTASSEQVRQPLYTAAVESWRSFDSYLDPLKGALGPVLDVYPTVQSTGH